MATTSYSTNPRISSLGYQRSKYADIQSTNTHNNNQPFSYTTNPREIIYARVVAGQKDRGGLSSKRTVHSRVLNSSYDNSSPSSLSSPTINHFVYERSNKENKGYREASPKHVTTVLLNSSDEDYSYGRAGAFPYKPERSFRYEPQAQDRYTFQSSSHQNLSSSSREASPAPVSARLVREADRWRGPGRKSTHTHYNYMNEKMGYMTPSEFSEPGGRGRSYDSSLRYYDKGSTLRRDVLDYRAGGTLTKPAGTAHVGNNVKSSYSSMERKENKKNGEFPRPPAPVKALTPSKPPPPAGGFISTLMRRNKDKKVAKEETAGAPEKPVKKQRRFLSIFTEPFGRKPVPAVPIQPNPNVVMSSEKARRGRGTLVRGNSKVMTTDSEIEEAERRRDGEYHSWSSVDDFYHSGSKTLPTPSSQQRNKSYSIGTNEGKKQERAWHEPTPSSDYHRPLPTSTPRYESATLGRQPKPSFDSSMANRTKSLDRRAPRNPPVIVVTPHSPEVDILNDDELWRSTRPSQHVPLQTTLSGRSKSSADLDGESKDKLRYFGDTDRESFHTYSRPRPFLQQNGGHVARKDKYMTGASPLLSSESEVGGRQSSNQSSQRSVYLHAPTVAEIPPNTARRTLSRDEISNYSGPQKQAQHLTRSVSVLAPWRPRHYREQYELNYNKEGLLERGNGRPPKPPRSPIRKSLSPGPEKSASSESLLRPDRGPPPRRPKQPVRSATLGRAGPPSISRSKSMPGPGKDERVSGWLQKRRKEKK